MIKKLHSSRGRKLRYIKLLFTIEQLGLKDSMNAMALYKAAGKKARDTTIIIKMCSNHFQEKNTPQQGFSRDQTVTIKLKNKLPFRQVSVEDKLHVSITEQISYLEGEKTLK